MELFDFEKLEVYQAARAFKLRIYKLAELLPRDEKYRMKFQMRDAARSMTNCISEGHGRYTFKDRTHFFHEARGSLQELVDDMNDCLDNNYAKAEHLDNLREDAHRVRQLIDGYIRYMRKQAQAKRKTPSNDKS
jgi:four helix bundle protein